MVLRDFLPASQPRLADLTSCEDWLARAALAGMPHACSAFLTLLEEIEAHPPRHSAYRQSHEPRRYPSIPAEAPQTNVVASKPLPPPPHTSPPLPPPPRPRPPLPPS